MKVLGINKGDRLRLLFFNGIEVVEIYYYESVYPFSSEKSTPISCAQAFSLLNHCQSAASGRQKLPGRYLVLHGEERSKVHRQVLIEGWKLQTGNHGGDGWILSHGKAFFPN
jgi:hypothetical protein